MFQVKSAGRTSAVAALVLSVALFGSFGSAVAQARKSRRESTSNRQNRIRRMVAETYSHKYEVAGGGGFLRFRPGSYLRRDNQIDWATSGTYYLNPAYGIVADVRGHFGDASLPNNFTNNVFHPLINEYTFMAGPQWRFYRTEKYAVSAHVLGGMARGEFDGGTKGVPATEVGLWPTSSALAVSAGVNFDYNIYPNLALRVTPTYIFTNFGSSTQNNKGVNAQVVYRFGHIK